MIPANNHPEINRLIHLKKHLGGMTMSKLISCQFNIDTACVELVFDDGSQIPIDCRRPFRCLANKAGKHRLCLPVRFKFVELLCKITLKRFPYCT